MPSKNKKKKKTGKKSKKDSQKSLKKRKCCFFGRLSKKILVASSFFLASYFVFGLAIGPDFLKKDLEDKYGKVLGAVSVNVLVRGTPVKPAVAAAPECGGSYPHIDLDWGDDLGVDTYDVYRDGALLIAGVTASNYQDSNVTALTSYGYYVVANGPVGNRQSDAATIQAPECYTPPPPVPPATISQVIISGIDVTNFKCCPIISKTKPVLSGTTNVSKARVSVGIRRGRRGIISTFSANQNGYWSWQSRSKLKKGLQNFYLTIADPADASRVVSASFQIRIGKKKIKKKQLAKCTGGTILKDITYGVHPFFANRTFGLAVGNPGGMIHSGEVLGFSLSRFQDSSFQSGESSYNLEILNQRGDQIFGENRVLAGQGEAENIRIGENIAPGKYKIAARYFAKNSDISAEDNFEVKEKPLLVLGTRWEITYRQILGSLGWAAFFSLGLLGVFLLLLLFEYHLSRKAIFQVTESDLKRRGMID